VNNSNPLERKPRFQIGQKVYLQSRYDGVVERIVTHIIPDDEVFLYGLDRSVQYQKDGKMIGSPVIVYRSIDYSRYDDGSDIRDVVWDSPAPEFVIMKIGDFVYGTMPMIAGPTDKVLTLEMVNFES
jgi:hypothetical protein